tara:strand:- start:57 stop:668 length:612 start_codon:yes stop_codon:yes gene_type:complete
LLLNTKFTHADSFGYFTGLTAITYNPGGILSNNNDEAHRAFSNDPFSESEYLYVKFKLNRTTYLPLSMQWYTSIEYQYANSNLLPSEQISLGGSRSIRGFEQNTVNADEGVKIINELRLPNKIFSEKHFADLAFFVDWGSLRNHQFITDDVNEFSLGSYGVNLKYGWSEYISGQISYGEPIANTGIEDGTKEQTVQMGLLISY